MGNTGQTRHPASSALVGLECREAADLDLLEIRTRRVSIVGRRELECAMHLRIGRHLFELHPNRT